MLRRLRAALGIGLTWALAWGAAGGLAFTLVWLGMEPYQRGRTGWANGIATSAMATLIAAMLGMIGGVLFATLLGVGERKGNVDQLSLRRIALLGGAGSLGLYLAASVGIGLLTESVSLGIGFVTGTAFGAGVFTALGAASASMTLRLAQRAAVGDGDGMALLP